MTAILARLRAYLWGCGHRDTGRLTHHDADGEYQRCRSCGARVAVTFDDVGIVPPRNYPKLRPLKARRGRKDAWAAKLGVKL